MYEENFCIQRIRELMVQNDYNPYRLAKQSGVSLATLNSMFDKNTSPRVDTLEKLCSACGITVSQFFERSSADLTKDQQEVLTQYTRLSPEKKRVLKSFLRFLCSENG